VDCSGGGPSGIQPFAPRSVKLVKVSFIATQSRVIQITKLARDPAHVNLLRAHLEQVIQGNVFGGCPRSQQFLRHVVEKSIAGDFDSLKERVIGVELFHRSPSYNKGEDAIVRVTASDVRKRLSQHYTEHGEESELRIDIPPGSYIPEITWTPSKGSTSSSGRGAATNSESVKALQSAPRLRAIMKSVFYTKLAFFSIPLVLSLFAFSFWAGYSVHKSEALRTYRTLLPWSAILSSAGELQIVASDPDFASEQDITKHVITLSDYANGKYVPDGPVISPEIRDFCLRYLRGTRAAEIDLPIVASIVSLTKPSTKRVAIRSARLMRTSDFQSDSDFILLGSPIANPWLEMFDPQLDFRFIYTGESSLQSIENVHPRENELKVYTPQGSGFGTKPPTGVAFAIVAFVQNPRQSGHVLILAGTGAEGTRAASQLVIGTSDLASALRNCGDSQNEPLRDFEILLRVNMMAGSPTNTDVVACHRLPFK